MSADRELLELAAKAIGLEIYGWDKTGSACIDPVEYFPWNPLENYHEALMLAKGAGLSVSACALLDGGGVAISGYVDAQFARESYSGGINGRRDAACRAIVRAAAEIGRQIDGIPSGSTVRG